MRHFKGLVCGILALAAMYASAQSPHGDALKVRCDACHTADSWNITRDSIAFNHDSTSFALEGRHQRIDCRQCHTDLEFSKAESNCASCHLDVHQQTAGDHCARCHTSESWLVANIAHLHSEADVL